MEDIFNDVTGPRSSQMRIQDFNYIIFELSVDAFIFFASFYKFFYKNDFVCLLLVKHKAMATSMTSPFAATPNWSIYCFFFRAGLVNLLTINLLNIITAKHKGSRASSPQLH